MNEPDVGQVEQRLAAVMKKERREAIGYTVIIVLCTPAFVLASLLGMIILFYVLGHPRYDIDALGIYTGINIFLALMLGFVLKRSNPPERPHEFDKTWLVGVIVFLFLLVLTYVTSLRVQFPLFFGILYGLLGFLVLGLLGQVQMNKPVTDDTGS
jgi:peptidoglycan/LPS O-acetylase OafA/YrhL